LWKLYKNSERGNARLVFFFLPLVSHLNSLFSFLSINNAEVIALI